MLFVIWKKLGQIHGSSSPYRHDKPSGFFTLTICHNSINVHPNPIKICTEMHFMSAKFQLGWSMYLLHFVVSVQNEEVKKRNLNCNRILENLPFWVQKVGFPRFSHNFVCLYISRDWQVWFASNLECLFTYLGGLYVAKFIWIWINDLGIT